MNEVIPPSFLRTFGIHHESFAGLAGLDCPERVLAIGSGLAGDSRSQAVTGKEGHTLLSNLSVCGPDKFHGNNSFTEYDTAIREFVYNLSVKPSVQVQASTERFWQVKLNSL